MINSTGIKNYFKTIVKITFFVPIIILSSCYISDLDAPPLGQTENDYFKTADQFRKAVIGMYGYLTDWYWYNSGNWLQGMYYLPSDAITEDKGDPTFELFSNITPTNSKIDYFFQRTYLMIQRANVIIEKAENVDLSSFDNPDAVKHAHGEALFIRALAEFKLFNKFGTAPIVTKRITTRSNTNTPQSKGVELLDQAIKDLKEASKLLPLSWDDENLGRATKNAANGLLVKCFVFRGDYSGNQIDYSDAVKTFNKITGVRLVSNYKDNFSSRTENNAESLFEFQAGKPSSNFSNVFLANDGPWRGVENMEAYWGFYTTGNYAPNNVIGDLTFEVTDKVFDKFGDDPRVAFYTEGHKHYFTKYARGEEKEYEAVTANANVGSINNVRIIRYADIMLLDAEAILKSGGSIRKVINILNKVRSRARKWGASQNITNEKVPRDYPISETDQNVIMKWIMNERLVELLGEGKRWPDLKRWDAAGNISLKNWDGTKQYFDTNLSGDFNFKYPKHLLWPIPQAEIDRNNKITKNNPGY